MYNYPTVIIKFIHSFLQNRHLIVSVDGFSSTKRKVRAGVTQGSVLGPKLFNIYLNDIPKFEKTKISLFADDTAVYCHSFYTIIAAKQIQIHLYKLEQFYRVWKISLNTRKTELIVFAKKNSECKNISTYHSIWTSYNSNYLCKISRDILRLQTNF